MPASSPTPRVNLAENLLVGPGDDSLPAIVFEREDGQRRTLTWGQLRVSVSAVVAGLRGAGVHPGDRVAAWMPNLPETVIAFLATNAIGAIFSSTSADFGTAGVIDRFGQIDPVVLFAADGYMYGGKRFDCLERLAEISAALPTVRRVVVTGNLRDDPDLRSVAGCDLIRRIRVERRDRARVHAHVVRPPGRDPLLVRYDRSPEVHRPSRRWAVAEAPQ